MIDNPKSLMRYTLLLALLCMFHATNSYGQDYKYGAKLGEVPTTGFYKIPINPELSALAKSDLSDIRIKDSDVFVPYIHHKDNKTEHKQSFINFHILSNTSDNKYTTVTIENPGHNGISELSLVIKNTCVERNTQLSGSDDKTNWYIINDKIRFAAAIQTGFADFTQTIQFPLSTYRYYKLKIDNAHTDPMNIERAGLIVKEDSQDPPGFLTNPVPSVIQKDSNNGRTYLLIKNAAPYLVNEVTLQVEGPKFYSRTGVAYLIYNEQDSNRFYNSYNPFTISSGVPVRFTVNCQKAKNIIIHIDNKDDKPLKFTGASTLQVQQYLVAWLEKGKTYTLVAGNPDATYPQYDLSLFKDSIPQQLNILTYSPFTSTPLQPAVVKEKPKTNQWLWPVIIIAVLSLGYLTYRMANDIKQKGV